MKKIGAIIHEILEDKNDKLSSKRVAGYLLIIAAVTLAIIGEIDTGIIETMIWAGAASLGVGTLETKVAK